MSVVFIFEVRVVRVPCSCAVNKDLSGKTIQCLRIDDRFYWSQLEYKQPCYNIDILKSSLTL